LPVWQDGLQQSPRPALLIVDYEQTAKAIIDDFEGQTFCDAGDAYQWLERRIIRALREAELNGSAKLQDTAYQLAP
jgi:hypothetical protein